jgi:hypothetical protein
VTDSVRVGLRVPRESLSAFETAVGERFGKRRHHAATECAREMQTFADNGPAKRLHDNITALSSSLASKGSEKNGLDAPRGETTICQYYVAPSVKSAFMKAASRDDRGAGEVLGDLMFRYATDGGPAARQADRVGRLLDVQRDAETDNPARQIASHLGDQFVLADVETAAEEAGYNSVDYAISTYLSDVLTECGATWHPNNPELFVPVSSDVVPSDRDPRSMPWRLMSDTDKEQAILRELREESIAASSQTRPNLDVSEMRAVLGDRPQPETVVQLARQLASETDNAEIVEKPEWEHPRLAGRDLAASADDELEKLSQARPAATDGGQR